VKAGLYILSMQPFHLAIPVHDLKAAHDFYAGLLGCATGRRADAWSDYDFFGHQLSVHLKPEETSPVPSNPVDGKDVPVRHFGIVLAWDGWHTLAARLKREGVAFIIEPGLRFEGEIGEQATMFFADPSGNMLEFKSFRDPARLFAH
jgi:extradiol dioxygenase family protein